MFISQNFNEKYKYGVSKTCNGVEMIQSKANENFEHFDYGLPDQNHDCFSGDTPPCFPGDSCEVVYDYKIHRKTWTVILEKLNQEVVDAFKTFPEETPRDKYGNPFEIPDISKQIFYLDVGHFIFYDNTVRSKKTGPYSVKIILKA